MGPPVRGRGRWGPPALLDSPAPHHTLWWGGGLLLTSAPQVPCPSPLAHPFSTKRGLLLPQPRSIPSSRIFTSSMSQCSQLTMSPTVPTSSGIEYGRDTPICLQGGQGSLLKGGAGSAQLSNPSIQLRSVPKDVDICSAAQPGDHCSPWAPRSPITSRDELQLHSSPWACPFFFSDPVDTGQTRKRSSRRRRRNKGPQLIIPQNRTPALEETTNPGIGKAAQGHDLATVFVLDTLSLVQSLTSVTISASA